jgi:hypothetical protein
VEERRKSIESFTSEMLFIAGGRLGVDGARRNELPVQNLVVHWAKNGRAISTGRSVGDDNNNNHRNNNKQSMRSR